MTNRTANILISTPIVNINSLYRCFFHCKRFLLPYLAIILLQYKTLCYLRLIAKIIEKQKCIIN